MFDLTGKRAIVTGGSRGIGRAIALALCRAGAKVVVIGTGSAVHEAAADIAAEAPGLAIGVQGDVGDRAGRQGLFDSCVELLDGGLDILVNNAGVNIRNKPVLDYPYEDYDRELAVNMEAVFFLSQMAAKLMIPQRSGKIIVISSIGGMKGTANGAAIYSMTKSAVIAMAKSMTCEWAKYGLCINVIAPGFTVTELAQKAMQDPVRMESVYARIPDGRLGRPEDMMGAAVFLASDASSHINGVVLPVDGGSIAG